MKKKIKTWGALFMLAVTLMTSVPAVVKADGVTGQEGYVPYLSLGADLKESERATVLKLMDITEEDVKNFDVIEVTNEEEKKYLGEYVDASIIGSRALSSVLVVKKEDGYGITVDTHNITYCTQGMYCNALITAGIENAKVVAAGPFEITGTAALVGAMQAYSVMTGKEITEETMDTAVNELVVTGNLAEDIGDSEKVEQLMAMVKQEIIEGDLKDPEEIGQAVGEAAKQMGIELSEDQVARVTSLMEKISTLDIDKEALKDQAEKLYDKISNMDTQGFLDKVEQFLNSLFEFFSDFFTNLFH
ncbi:MAG: DUF1002 domain-containing protein [Acetivibrio sp.]